MHRVHIKRQWTGERGKSIIPPDTTGPGMPGRGEEADPVPIALSTSFLLPSLSPQPFAILRFLRHDEVGLKSSSSSTFSSDSSAELPALQSAARAAAAVAIMRSSSAAVEAVAIGTVRLRERANVVMS